MPYALVVSVKVVMGNLKPRDVFGMQASFDGGDRGLYALTRLREVSMLAHVIEVAPELLLQTYVAAYEFFIHNYAVSLVLAASIASSSYSLALNSGARFLRSEPIVEMSIGSAFFVGAIFARLMVCVLNFVEYGWRGTIFAGVIVGIRCVIFLYLDSELLKKDTLNIGGLKKCDLRQRSMSDDQTEEMTTIPGEAKNDETTPRPSVICACTYRLCKFIRSTVRGCVGTRGLRSCCKSSYLCRALVRLLYYFLALMPPVLLTSIIPLGGRNLTKDDGTKDDDFFATTFTLFDSNLDCQSVRNRLLSPLGKVMIALHVVENVVMLTILAAAPSTSTRADVAWRFLVGFVVAPMVFAGFMGLWLYSLTKDRERLWKDAIRDVADDDKLVCILRERLKPSNDTSEPTDEQLREHLHGLIDQGQLNNFQLRGRLEKLLHRPSRRRKVYPDDEPVSLGDEGQEPEVAAETSENQQLAGAVAADVEMKSVGGVKEADAAGDDEDDYTGETKVVDFVTGTVEISS